MLRMLFLCLCQKLPKVNRELAQKLLELEMAEKKKKKVTASLYFYDLLFCLDFPA